MEIHKALGKFSYHTRFVVGDSVRIRFWHDEALKELFLDVYNIAQAKDASVADHMEISTQLIRPTPDWEIDTFTTIFNILYSTRLRQKGVDKCFEPLTRERCSMSLFSYNFLTPHNNPFLEEHLED